MAEECEGRIVCDDPRGSSSGSVETGAPTAEVCSEIVNYLRDGDQTRLGAVHDGPQRELSAERYCDKLEVATSSFV